MRRGPGGGLVVVEPSVDAIVDATVIYLLRVGARLDEVVEARLVLEQIVSELAARRVSETDLFGIRELVREEAAGRVANPPGVPRFARGPPAATGNPVLELFRARVQPPDDVLLQRRPPGDPTDVR